MAVLPTTLNDAIAHLRIVFLVTIAAAALSGLAIAYFLSRSVTTSVAQVVEAASVLARGELSRHVPASGDDELGVLSESFNTMVENLARTTLLVRDAYLRAHEGREHIPETTIPVLHG